MIPALVVVADDLTGASDAGVQFAKCGAATTVWIDHAQPFAHTEDAACDVAVVDLDSRAVAPDVANARMRETLAQCGDARILKKIDSTLRGNIAAELEAILSARPDNTAVVVAAYPKNGRTQRDGVLYVHDTPVHETDFGRDLFTPVRSSRIADYLPAGSAIVAAAADVARARDWGARAIAVDAQSDDDLVAIAALAADPNYVWIGSAGILEVLAPLLVPSRARTDASLGDARGPVLFVIGSLSDTTRTQMHRYAEAGGLTELVDPRTVLIDEGRGRAEIVAERIRTTLAAGRDLLVALSSERSDVEAALSLGRAHGYDAATTSLELRQRFVALVQRAVPLAGAVVLSGADVARAFCVEAGVRGMRLIAEAAPGIPLSRGLGRDMLLVTKAGGFGAPDAYATIARTVRKELVP